MKNRFRREIALTLAFKALALVLLWAAFFRHSADENVDALRAGSALFGPNEQVPSLSARPSDAGPAQRSAPADPSR